MYMLYDDPGDGGGRRWLRDYYYDYENDEGCLSADTLRLTVFHSSRYDTVVDVCKNELPFVFMGRSLTRSDEYEFPLETAHGCDSLIVLHLTVYLTYNRQKDMTICEEELPILFMDSVITKGGNYVFKKKSLHGCDSMVTLHLTVNEGTHNVETEIACDSFTWHGIKYMESGDYTFDYENETGCLSTDTLHLTVNHSEFSAMTSTECDSIIWHGKKYTESGDYIYDYISSDGCPCTDTLHLTIHHPTHSSITETVCDSIIWHGKSYTESGDYTYDYENEEGCQSVDTLHLAVYQSVKIDTMIAVCEEELPYLFMDSTLSEEGEFEFHLQTVHGCDSTVLLHLTVDQLYEQDTSVIVCNDWLPLLFADSLLTEGGDYEFSRKSSAGCDSLIKLHLFVNTSPTISLGEDQQ